LQSVKPILKTEPLTRPFQTVFITASQSENEGKGEKMKNVGVICLSHSPLRDKNRPALEMETCSEAALPKTADFVAENRNQILRSFYARIVNGFFYRLLPPHSAWA